MIFDKKRWKYDNISSLKLNVGDFVEATISNHTVVLQPKSIVDRTLEQSLKEGLADIAAGRVSGPYRSGKALVAALHGKRKARRAR